MKKWTNAEVIELDVTETSCGGFYWWPWKPSKPKFPCQPPVVVTPPTTTPDEPPVTEEPPVVESRS